MSWTSICTTLLAESADIHGISLSFFWLLIGFIPISHDSISPSLKINPPMIQSTVDQQTAFRDKKGLKNNVKS